MTIKYCLQCTAPLNMQDDTSYVCDNGHAYWNNPHTGAAVIFIQDRKILVVKRGIEPHKGLYCFTGGFMQYGEQPHDAAVREIKEETGVDVLSLELIASYTDTYEVNETSCAILFLARDWDGDFIAGDDAVALVWKPLDFIETDMFAWHYPGLAAKLETLTIKR